MFTITLTKTKNMI